MNYSLILDRFESKYAILESQEKTPIIFNFPRNLLPPDTKEGSVLRFNIDIDNKATTRRKDNILAQLKRLKKKDDGGDIQL